MHCGIRHNHAKKDLALIKASVRCAGAGCYTTNKVYGAPITVDREHLADGYAQAIVVNSGNANTCAPNGLQLARDTCGLVAEALGIRAEDVLPSSTGVIGQEMSIEPFARGIPELPPSWQEQLMQGISFDSYGEAKNHTTLIKKQLKQQQAENKKNGGGSSPSASSSASPSSSASASSPPARVREAVTSHDHYPLEAVRSANAQHADLRRGVLPDVRTHHGWFPFQLHGNARVHRSAVPAAWGLLLRFQPYASQTILCCVMLLTGIGVTMIARIDQETKTSVAFKQLMWLAIALVLSACW